MAVTSVPGQARALLWAQTRSLANSYFRSPSRARFFSSILFALWYGSWVLTAITVYVLLSDPGGTILPLSSVPGLLLLVFLGWQVFPILIGGSGSYLYARLLAIYPIAPQRLFVMEAVLQLTAGVEMLLVLIGVAAGLLRRPGVPAYSIGVLAVFVVFNMLLGAGLRELIEQWIARYRLREAATLLMTLVVAIPPLLLITGIPDWLRGWYEVLLTLPSPWTAAGHLAIGQGTSSSAIWLAIWTGGAFAFGRWRFSQERWLDTARSKASEPRRDSLMARIFIATGLRLSRLLADPLGALVEKEIRFLSRAPRFRLVFLMGFTFGQLVWLPLLAHDVSPDTPFGSNYFAIVCLYGLMLIADSLFWNSFGFDRSAAQLYYVSCAPLRTVLKGKNLAALYFVALELALITVTCLLIRVPLTPVKAVESYLAAAVFVLFLMGLGNLASVHEPRAVNPAQLLRSSATSRFHAFLLVVYPIIAAPIAIAYLVRHYLRTEVGFLAVLALSAMLGSTFYIYSLRAAERLAYRERERFLAALASGDGPVLTS